MNCENVNIKELLQKVEKYDILDKKFKCAIKEAEKLEKFFQSISVKKEIPKIITELYYTPENKDFHYAWGANIIEFIKNITNKEHQAFCLAEERKKLVEQYEEKEKTLFAEVQRREQELTEAWVKFQAIKTSHYQKALKEINEENLS